MAADLAYCHAARIERQDATANFSALPDRSSSPLRILRSMSDVEFDATSPATGATVPEFATKSLPALAGSCKIVRGNSWKVAHFCARLPAVNGREFIARVRRLARRNGIAVRFDRTRGKGSHGTLYYGDRHTVVKDRRKPLKTGTLRGMCKQLGIDSNDL